MSPRKLLRIFLVVVILFLLWMRGLVSWPLAALLLVLAILLMAGIFRKRRLPRDEVPKRPLGLED